MLVIYIIIIIFGSGISDNAGELSLWKMLHYIVPGHK
jgi:hypothetical protein